MNINKLITQKEDIKFSKVQKEDIDWAIKKIDKDGVPNDFKSH